MPSRKSRSRGRPVTYWHGGVPGLRQGEYLQPRSLTRTHSYADLDEEYPGAADRVHITVDKQYAVFHASAYVLPGQRPEGGTLYEVAPVGKLEPDPDDVPGQSYAVPRARILRVAALRVLLSPLEGQLAQRDHSLYVGGHKMYDPEGWLLAAPDRAHLPEVQHELDRQNELTLLTENIWRKQHNRPPLPRPSWLTRPADFDAYLQARMMDRRTPFRRLTD